MTDGVEWQRLRAASSRNPDHRPSPGRHGLNPEPATETTLRVGEPHLRLPPSGVRAVESVGHDGYRRPGIFDALVSAGRQDASAATHSVTLRVARFAASAHTRPLWSS
jgi:hypothetical protein